MMKKWIVWILAAICVLAVTPAAAAESREPDAVAQEAAVPDAGADENAVDSAAAAEPLQTTRADRDLAPTGAEFPQITAVTPATIGLTVTWSAVSDAELYYLYEVRENIWRVVARTTATSYTHADLDNDTVHRYTVRAVDAEGVFSDYDHVGVTVTYHSTPVLSGVTNSDEGQKVSWNPVEGAESYRVYIRTATSWKGVVNTPDPCYLNTDVLPGAAYTYTVRCISADGAQLQSGYDRSGMGAVYYTTPRITSVTAVNGGLQVSWDAVAGDPLYRLFYKNGASWKAIATTAASSYTYVGIAEGSALIFTVRAVNAQGAFVSDFDRVGVAASYLGAPVLDQAISVVGGQKVSWNPVEGAESYRVYIKTTTGWKGVANTTDLYYVNPEVQSGASYTYTVRCITADGKQLQSYFDRKGVSGVYVAAPQITGFEPIDGGVRVSWDAVAGAAQYLLFYHNGTNWKTIGTTAALSMNHMDLDDGAVYLYTVRATDAKGAFVSGYCAEGWEHRYDAPPEITSVSCRFGKYTLGWEPKPEAAGYRLYRSVNGDDWEPLCDLWGSDATTYTDNHCAKSYVYGYALCTLDADGQPLSGFRRDSLYYFKGEPANTEVEWYRNIVSFENGHPRSGFVTVDGRQYYYNAHGVMQKNGIVGSEQDGYTYADKNGVCCISEEIRLAAAFMMTCATGDTLAERMKTGYLYLSRQFPYHRSYDHPSKAEEMAALAIDMFQNEQGNCYRYAACFTCLAKIAGYRARVVIGTTGGNPHGWVEVLVNGVWLICDPDADIPKYQNPDYTAYMMRQHYWQITPKVLCELTIDDNGVAVWI